MKKKRGGSGRFGDLIDCTMNLMALAKESLTIRSLDASPFSIRALENGTEL